MTVAAVESVAHRSPLRELAGLYAAALSRLRASPSLRRSLGLWLAIGFIATESYAIAVALLHDRATLPAIALGAAAWWALVGAILVGGAPLLVTPQGHRIDRYGVPNGLTALRAWACYPLLLTALLALPGELGLALWCSVGWVSGMLDFVDGLIARRVGPITALGKALDPAMDALFFMMAAVGNVRLGILPAWLSALIIVRFAGPLLATPIVFLTGRRPELTHTVWGRRNTGATGMVIFILMWVRIFGGPVGAVAPVIALPTLLPSTLLHFRALWIRAVRAPRGAGAAGGP